MADEWVLLWQSRWTSGYGTPDNPTPYCLKSRFMEGTAAITLDELKREWGTWSWQEQIDFCQAYRSARLPDPDVIRFVVANGDHRTWPAIAWLAATKLPVEDSVPTLRAWCESCEVGGRSANYYQAVACTCDPEAHDILRRAFARVWATVGLMEPDDQGATHAACCCLLSLLELGEDPEEFRARYEALKRHPAYLDRWWSGRQLAKYFVEQAPSPPTP